MNTWKIFGIGLLLSGQFLTACDRTASQRPTSGKLSVKLKSKSNPHAIVSDASKVTQDSPSLSEEQKRIVLAAIDKIDESGFSDEGLLGAEILRTVIRVLKENGAGDGQLLDLLNSLISEFGLKESDSADREQRTADLVLAALEGLAANGVGKESLISFLNDSSADLRPDVRGSLLERIESKFRQATPPEEMTSSDFRDIRAQEISDDPSAPSSASNAPLIVPVQGTQQSNGEGAMTSMPSLTIAGPELDHVSPSVTSITLNGASPTAASQVIFDVAFSEAVTGVDTLDFALDASGVSGAVIDSVSGSGTSWQVTVSTGSGSGSVSIDLVNNSSIVDSANNALGASYTAGQAYAVDKAQPSVSGITRNGPSPTDASLVIFDVAFSEPVSGVDSGDFSLDVSGVTGASIGAITGSASAWQVTVNRGSGNGSVSINLVTNGSITDSAGNALGGSYTAGEAYVINENSAPTLSSSVLNLEQNLGTQIVLNWAGASDDNTSTQNLLYTVYRSSLNNIASVANCESNGTPVLIDSDGISYAQITSLSASTTYYFNVVVKDEAGLKTAYSPLAVTTGAGALAGSGTSGAPFLVSDLEDLNLVRIHAGSGVYFRLTANIDASETSGWFGGQGWKPLPSVALFDGNGFRIVGLTANRPTENDVGLFSALSGTGQITGVALVAADITGMDRVGGLVGDLTSSNANALTRSIVTGVISGQDYVGALLGRNAGVVKNSVSHANVFGRDYVGGAVGSVTSAGTSSSLNTRGKVSGRHNVGGVVGSYGNTSTELVQGFSQSHVLATGNNAGGLVGHTLGAVAHSGADSNVYSTGDNAGGLIGYTSNGVRNSIARGNVYGVTDVGGLVGEAAASALGSGTIATGRVSGQNASTVGMLVGNNAMTINHSAVKDHGDGYNCVALGTAVPAKSTGSGKYSGHCVTMPIGWRTLSRMLHC